MLRRNDYIWHQSPFSSSYVPPIPQLSIDIAGPDAEDWISVKDAIIDTGADTTIVPENFLSRIAAAEWDQAQLRS